MYSDLKQRLVDLAEEDRKVRAELAATGELHRGYAPRLAFARFSTATGEMSPARLQMTSPLAGDRHSRSVKFDPTAFRFFLIQPKTA
jgi:hypothetical protein